MNRKKILIICSVIFVSLVVVALFLLFKPKHYETSLTSPEKGFPVSVINIQGTEKLFEILPAKQYIAVRQALNSYIKSKFGDKVAIAQIEQGSTILNNDGSINFTVKTNSPPKTFHVILTRPNFSIIVFSVAEENSEGRILYPYGQ